MPALGATLITGTRIMDARHHPFDVMFGAVLGVLVAWGSYRQYFPPDQTLGVRDVHIPFEPGARHHAPLQTVRL